MKWPVVVYLEKGYAHCFKVNSVRDANAAVQQIDKRGGDAQWVWLNEW